MTIQAANGIVEGIGSKPWILASPPVPRPMHGLSPRTIFGRSWWREARQETLRKEGAICAATGEEFFGREDMLQCHEMYEYDFSSGRADFVGTCMLSREAHDYFHLGRTLAKCISKGHGWIDARFVDAVELGRSVLERAQIDEHYSRAYIYAKFLRYHNIPAEFNEFSRAAHLYELALIRGDNHSDELVPWTRWRLHVGGRVYKPRDESYDDYRQRYKR